MKYADELVHDLLRLNNSINITIKYNQCPCERRWAKSSKRANLRHAIRQNVRDLARRGLSNREGNDNRSYRKHKNREKIVFSTPFYVLTA